MYKKGFGIKKPIMDDIPYYTTKQNPINLIYMYKKDLALNSLQWLICHKNPTKQNLIYLIYTYKENLALNNLQSLICHKTEPIAEEKQDKRNVFLPFPTILSLKKTRSRRNICFLSRPSFIFQQFSISVCYNYGHFYGLSIIN